MSSHAEEPHIAAAIARAEARRAVLERVTAAAVSLMDDTIALEAVTETGAEGRDGTVRRFAQLARAVRLSLALEARIDAEILAMRNGEIPTPVRAGARAPAKPEPAAPAASDEGQCSVRDPIQAAVWGAIEQGVEDEAEGLHRFDRLYERLFETREYDRLDLGDFEGAVRAICADLGLEPDWTLWDGSDRFLRPMNAPRAWSRTAWRWRPDEAEGRRVRLLGSRRAGKAVKALARSGPFKLE